MAGNNYLPTEYQTFIHASRYARWLPDEVERDMDKNSPQDLLTFHKYI